MDWSQILANVPLDATEAIVKAKFIEPYLLKGLGFESNEHVPDFGTGGGARKVDFAARKNTPDDIFLQTKNKPYLIVEAKGRYTDRGIHFNLSENSSQYISTKEQLKGYLLDPNCEATEWGILTNATHIQLFRHHDRVVFPATPCIELTGDNIDKVISDLKTIIQNPSRCLRVCVYNNKGGVGKTTTTINLASALASQKKKILLVDFDSQRDLSRSLGLEPGNITLTNCLEDPYLDIHSTIQPFKLRAKKSGSEKIIHVLDVIPADPLLEKYTSHSAAKIQKGAGRLRDLLKPLANDYDYIFIDCPTQWLFFSKSGLFAADVVLIPTRHNDLSSLQNSVRVMQDFIFGEVKNARQDGGPIPLPIFFNGCPGDGTSVATAQKEIDDILEKIKNSTPDLTNYFYPKTTKAQKDKTIFSIPDYAIVASAAFSRVPAVFKNKRIAEYYLSLAREYFLNE